MRGRLRLAGLLLPATQLARDARCEGWSHVHVHSCSDCAFIALFTHLLADISYSLTLHGPLSDYGPGQGRKWEDAEFCIVITETLKRDVLRQLPDIPPGRITVAPMGVEVGRLRREAPYRARKGSEPIRIMSCGRLHRCKGHEDLIRAVARLREEGIESTLVIAGDGPERKSLADLVESLKLDDHVTLLGAVDEVVVRQQLEGAHVFALASHHEPLGVAIMEAMAMELPVVVTNAGGVPELVRDGVDGLLVSPRSPTALADALAAVAADPQVAERMGQMGAQRVRERFNSKVSAAAIAGRLGVGRRARKIGVVDASLLAASP